MHAEQAIACMNAGKHVQVEIPLADSWADAEAVLKKQQETGLVCMVGHTRRFNPSHQFVHNKIVAGEFNIQQMDVQTYFFRRKNMNAKGEARSWTDHLLWHHAAHTVDLFAYQAGPIVKANAIEGPHHPELGIAMDMSIQLKAASGAICTLSLSFNKSGGSSLSLLSLSLSSIKFGGSSLSLLSGGACCIFARSPLIGHFLIFCT
jgi:2-hydroxy-4-carboxymuconate semialdehyde hemiacetal dehydrogenase